ncbi:sulfate/molybdate ABC transporter ATP-binding protein [Salipaludibacillus sp. HK11]|uniref:sulfate/molybdate ABC transporter ATP-binding protein n=1 Tax=Salipaludibacillus sp. HK11 TaxID=3394320 RepID=UPI0039FC8B14
MLDVNIQNTLSSFDLNIQFKAERGITAILGPSGCGKTMTLQSLAGIIKPDSGVISMDGQTWFDKAQQVFWKPQKRQVGYLFQNYALFPHLTVEQNIAFGLKGMVKQEIDQKVSKWLNIMQMDGFKDRYPAKMSGGQQQRVALARSMITEPQLLLLDEPFSALDQHIRHSLEADLRNIIDDTFHGVVLFVTHNIEEAYRMSDSIMLFNEGEVIQKGSRKEILQHPQSKKAAEIVGCENVVRIDSHKQNQDDFELTIGDGERLFVIGKEQTNDTPKYVGIHNHHMIVSSQQTSGENVKRAKVRQIIEGVTYTIMIVEFASFRWRVEAVEGGHGKQPFHEGDDCFITFPKDKLIVMNK